MPPVWQINIAGVDGFGFLIIDQKKMIAAGRTADIHILANLDEAFGAQNRQAAIAPAFQAVGREPVHAHVAHTAVAAHHNVAKILQIGILRIPHVTHLRSHDMGLGTPRKKQELVELVRTDVGDDAAVVAHLEKPFGTRLWVHPVRA